MSVSNADNLPEETTNFVDDKTSVPETKPIVHVAEEKESIPDKKTQDDKESKSNDEVNRDYVVEDAPDVLTDSVHHKTGEDDEMVLLNVRARLYRFDTETSEWKERGTGSARLLKHKENHRVRFLMRRDKTYKICGNHYVCPFMKLEPNKNNDKSWIWSCPKDFSEDYNKPSSGVYAIRLQSIERAKEFKEVWEKAREEVGALCGND